MSTHVQHGELSASAATESKLKGKGYSLSLKTSKIGPYMNGYERAQLDSLT
jgi:hypothetical protein